MPIEDANKKRAREAAARLADRYCDRDGGAPDVRETLADLDFVEMASGAPSLPKS